MRHRLSVPAAGQQMGDVRPAGQAVGLGLHGHHRIEAQEREVGDVVAREPVPVEVGVDAAQSPETSPPGPQASPVGHLDGVAVPDHHVGYRPAAVDQDADLATDLAADLGQLAGEVVGDETLGGQTAAREALEGANLAGLESVRVPEDADWSSSLPKI